MISSPRRWRISGKPWMRDTDTALEGDTLLLLIQQEFDQTLQESKTRGRKATSAERVHARRDDEHRHDAGVPPRGDPIAAAARRWQGVSPGSDAQGHRVRPAHPGDSGAARMEGLQASGPAC